MVYCAVELSVHHCLLYFFLHHLEQCVLQFDVPVGHSPPVTVVYTNNKLLEEPPRDCFLQPAQFLYILEQRAASGVLHHNADEFAGQEHLLELYDVWVTQQAVVDKL